MVKKELTIDFVVNAFIVYKGKVLLILHKKLGSWMPIGGHIEPKEDTEQAILREIKEECGLKVKILSQKPSQKTDTKFLYVPSYLDIHDISHNHKHIAFNYFAKTTSDRAKLNKNEHNDIKWFSKNDLGNKKYHIKRSVIFLAKEAIKYAENN